MEYGPPRIVRTVQKASCGDIKNLKRSGAVCEPLPVKRTAKKYKVFPASSIRCWPLFSVPGMGSISARCALCTGTGLICGEGEGFVFGCVHPEEDDGAAWAILLRKNGFSPGFVKFLPKFKKVLASYTGVRCMILPRKKKRRNGTLAGAAPVTFRVEKRTFRADSPTRLGKYTTLNV